MASPNLPLPTDGSQASPGLEVAQDFYTTPGSDARDLTEQQISRLKRELDSSLFLFAVMICGYRDLTPSYHGPICRFLDKWGRTDLPGGSPNFGHKRLMLQISRDTFKCEKNSIVSTTYGPKRIEDLQVGDELLALSDQFQLSRNTVVATEPGRGPLYEVVLRSGLKITVTPNHPLRTVLGWKEVSNLKPGDGVATARRLVCPPPTGMYPYTAGALCGDGCMGTIGPPTITCFDPEIIEGCRGEGVEVRTRNKIGVYSIPQPYSKEFPPSMRVGSWEKSIPPTYEGSGQFLSGLFDTDGTVQFYKGTPRAVILNTVSTKLATDVVRNLRYFGIVARMHNHATQGPDGYRGTVWHVSITGKNNAVLFEKYVGFKVRRKVLGLAALIEYVPEGRTSSRREAVPPEWRKLLKNTPRGGSYKKGEPRLLKDAGVDINNNYWTSRAKVKEAGRILNRSELSDLASDDVCWDEVSEVNYLGEGDIVQLEVSGNHSYISNCVLSHNTSVGTIANALQKVARSEGGMATVGIFNAKEGRTFAWIRTIRELVETNRIFQAVYRDLVPPGISFRDKDLGKTLPQRWRWSDQHIDLVRERPLPEASISGHGATGSAAGWHFDYVIKDDLIESKHAMSQVEMNRVWEWCETARYLEKPAEKGNELWNYTRWHYNDVYARARRQWPDDYVAFHRKILEIDNNGEEHSTFPERFTTKELQRERESRPFYFAAQRQNEPRAGKEQSFDESWLRYGSVSHIDGQLCFIIDSEHYNNQLSEVELDKGDLVPKVIPLSWMDKILCWDPAPSEQTDKNREQNARNGLAVLGKDPWGRVFVLSAKGYKLDPEIMMRHSIHTCLHWGCAKAAVEEVNFSKVYKHFANYLLRKEFPRDHVSFIPQKAEKQSKDARILGLVPLFRTGFIYFNKPECKQLELEYMEYPFSTTRDILDALAMHPKILFRPLSIDEQFYLQTNEPGQANLPGQLDNVNWAS